MKYFKQSEHKFKLKMPPSFILFEKYPSGIGIDFVIIKKIILWGAFETNKMMVQFSIYILCSAYLFHFIKKSFPVSGGVFDKYFC